ncbi:hypothetical protein SAMN02799630_01394 [Paenibacillus sp. UNCCL117]|nr:hypothetical protein SAMN02799630_01394 [Paenibacillus sp. UNCCL117]
MHIAIQGDPVGVADQPELDLLRASPVTAVAFDNLQRLAQFRVCPVNGHTRRVAVKHAHRDALVLVHMQLEVGVNVVDVRFIKPVQVASECVVVEPGGLKAWTKQLIQIVLRGPFIHIHQGISTTQHVEYQQLDSFPGCRSALPVYRRRTPLSPNSGNNKEATP